MLVAAAVRAITPDPVKPAKSKRGPKKGTKSKQSIESSELFQMPNPVPLMKKSSTILGTPRVQRPPTPDLGGYATTSGGYSMNRRNSIENTAMQIQLSNRQTDQFRQIVEDNNEFMMNSNEC